MAFIRIRRASIARCLRASLLYHTISPPENARARALLHQGRLALEYCERLFEASDLGLTPLLPLLIRLRLGDAALLDLLVILEDARELLAGEVLVGGVLADGLVERLELLRLVLHVLLLQGPRDLVLLRDLLVLRLRIRLIRLLLGKILGEVRFHDLEDVDDASTGPSCRRVLLRKGRLLHQLRDVFLSSP